jgi:hypothetical protein
MPPFAWGHQRLKAQGFMEASQKAGRKDKKYEKKRQSAHKNRATMRKCLFVGFQTICRKRKISGRMEYAKRAI